MRGAVDRNEAVSGGSGYQAAKVRVHQVLWITYPHDPATRFFGFFIMTLIVLNVLAVILQTVESLDARYGNAFYYFEMASVIVFTIEYFLRLWACTVDERYSRPVAGRLRYVVTPLALIDLFAIAPFYPTLFVNTRGFDGTFFRAVRLIRLLRLFKTTRYVHSLDIMGRVFRAKKEQIVIAFLAIGVSLILLSSLVYFAEHTAVHEPNGREFSSIPASMWWGVSALTTVGYGDMVPVTPAGKIIATLIALLGIGLFALPAGILASGFSEEVRAKGGHRKSCPHCGREIE